MLNKITIGVAGLALLAACNQQPPVAPLEILDSPGPSAAATLQDRFHVFESDLGFQSTLIGLLTALDRRDLTVFAVIDHAAGAQNEGLELPPSTVVIFGSPKVGTPLIEAKPLMGAELPLKALVYQQGDTTYLAMTGMQYLERNHQLSSRSEHIDGIIEALDLIAEEATTP